MYDVLPDIPRWCTALAEILACCTYIFLYRSDFSKPKLIVAMSIMSLGQFSLQFLAGILPIQFWIVGMGLNMLYMYLFLLSLSGLEVKFSIYIFFKAFVLSEFLASFVWLTFVTTFLNTPLSNANFTLVYVLVGYGITFSIVFLIERKLMAHGVLNEVDTNEILTFAFITTTVFAMSNIGFLLSDTRYHLGNSLAIHIIRALVDFNGVCVLFLLQLQKNDRYLKEELNKVETFFNSRQYEKYKTFKENNELVNQKLHDLKHQVYLIKTEENEKARDKYLDEVLDDLQRMSVNIETGNPVLDSILTNKNTYCIEQKIIFSCFADGKLLDFMDTMDICSIFGNGLDNAIESVLKENDLEKRLINLKVVEQGGFILIKFENFSEKKPTFIDGMPLTTKKDTSLHGYGLKIMRYIANKYNGSITINYDDSWFIVKMLLPKTQAKREKF